MSEKIINMKKIKLTEGDLHRIIKESVNKVLNEISYGLAKSAYDKNEKFRSI